MERMLAHAMPMAVMEIRRWYLSEATATDASPSAPTARQRTCISLGPVYFVPHSSTNEKMKHTALYAAKQKPDQEPEASISTEPGAAWKIFLATAGGK